MKRTHGLSGFRDEEGVCLRRAGSQGGTADLEGVTKTKLSTGDSPLDLQAHHSWVFIAHGHVFKLLVRHKITQKVKSGAITLISQFKTETKLPSPISDPEIKEDRAVSPLRLGPPQGRTVSPLRLGLPEGRTVSPFRLGLPEAGLSPLRLGLPEGRAVSLQTGPP